MDLSARTESFRLTSLHLLGLWAITIAQPLFELLGRSPEFFVAHDAQRADIILLVVGLTIGVPSILIACVWLGGRYSQLVAIGALVSALAMQVAKQAGLQTWTSAVPIAVGVGVAAAVAYHRLALVRAFATLLSLAVIVVPAIFLTRPDIRRLINPARGAVPEVRQQPGAHGPGTLNPVLLVVLDETPLTSLLDGDGQIDSRLYPNLAQLAHDGVWFRNATTVNDFTPFAVPPILSGKFPRPATSPTHADHPQSLFTLLGQTHRLEVMESVTRLCPPPFCGPSRDPLRVRLASMASDLFIVYQHVLLTDDLRGGLPPLTDDWAGFGTSDGDEDARQPPRRRRRSKLEVAMTFADGISREDRQPTFYFIHTLLSHSPWLWLPSGQENATRGALSGNVNWWKSNDTWGVLQYYQRHLLQLGAVDRVIGRMVANLQAAGVYDRTLIVVTADHGIAFRPGFHRRNFAEETAAEIMRVPLIIKFPAGTRALADPPSLNSAGQRFTDLNAQTVDVAPTVVDVLGLELTWQTDGHSLLDPRPQPRESKRMFFDGARRTRFYPREGPDASEALRQKLEIFGSADNFYRVPHPGQFGELVGQPISALRVEDGGGRVAVDFLPQYQKVDTHANAVPFDVGGWIERPRSREDTAYIAVAINGTVRAVTKTWTNQRGRWLATPPLDAWRDGRNDLDVFVIDTDARGPLLRRTAPAKPHGPPA